MSKNGNLQMENKGESCRYRKYKYDYYPELAGLTNTKTISHTNVSDVLQ